VLVRGGLARAFSRHRSIPGAKLRAILAPASPDFGIRPGPEIALAATVLRAATADAGTAAGELALLTRDAATADRRRGDAAVREAWALAELLLGMRSGDAPAVDRAAARLTGPQTADDMHGAVLLAQASSHFWHGAHEDVVSLVGQALAAARHGGPAELAVEVLGMMAYVDGFLGRPRHADDAALQAHRRCAGRLACARRSRCGSRPPSGPCSERTSRRRRATCGTRRRLSRSARTRA
jgi:hypothetical protein